MFDTVTGLIQHLSKKNILKKRHKNMEIEKEHCTCNTGILHLFFKNS